MDSLLDSSVAIVCSEMSTNYTLHLLERAQEMEKEQRKRLDAAAVEFQRIPSFRKDNSEWLEPLAKKFRGAKGYLNGQNLPFYSRFQ